MTETNGLIAELRAMVALTNETPRIPALPRQLATEAANALEALAARNAVLEEESTFAQEIIAEFKSEVARLAENDPEFDALQKQRYPDDQYKGGWESGVLKSSAKQYRNAAMLALRENIQQRDEIRRLRSALPPEAREQ